MLNALINLITVSASVVVTVGILSWAWPIILVAGVIAIIAYIAK